MKGGSFCLSAIESKKNNKIKNEGNQKEKARKKLQVNKS